MEVDKLDVKLEPDYSEKTEGKLFLKLILTINGGCPLQVNDDDFDIAELLKSVKAPGTYLIWTCACGDAGCGGYTEGIHVSIVGDITIWKDRDQKKEYKFDTKYLNAKICALYDELLKWDLHAKTINSELFIGPLRTMKNLMSAIK